VPAGISKQGLAQRELLWDQVCWEKGGGVDVQANAGRAGLGKMGMMCKAIEKGVPPLDKKERGARLGRLKRGKVKAEKKGKTLRTS